MGLGPELVRLIDAMLNVLCWDVMPLTQQGVARGNKAFGAAVFLRKSISRTS